MSVICKKCCSSSYVKNGYVWGVQRYKCKSCGCNYVEGDKRQKYTTLRSFKSSKIIFRKLWNPDDRKAQRYT